MQISACVILDRVSVDKRADGRRRIIWPNPTHSKDPKDPKQPAAAAGLFQPRPRK